MIFSFQCVIVNELVLGLFQLCKICEIKLFVYKALFALYHLTRGEPGLV